MKGRVLIAGVGNSLRGDDGIGTALAELIREGSQGGNIEAAAFNLSGFDLVDYFEDYDRVYIIDAADMGCPPGEVRLLPEEELAALPSGSFGNSHSLMLRDLARFSVFLRGENCLRIIGIQPAAVTPGTGLSDGILAGLPALAGRIRDIIKSDSGGI